MIRYCLLTGIKLTGLTMGATLWLGGCAGQSSPYGVSGSAITNIPNFQRAPGRGQYVRPEFLEPLEIATLPPEDSCRSRLYLTLAGQHEGAIFIAGLPGRKRIVKPAILEDFEAEEENDFIPSPPLVEVIDFLPQQSIYASSIRTVVDRFLLTDEDENRLTLELDLEGYIIDIRCG
ncbi:MAG: hypothetical protein ABJG88_01900 [Litorimonas sp.]